MRAESIGKLVSSKYLTSKEKRLKRNYLTSNKLTSLDVKERALEIAKGLTNTEHPYDLTAWYCKAYRSLGESRYCMVANAAREGNEPRKLFGWLLKEEMNARMAKDA